MSDAPGPQMWLQRSYICDYLGCREFPLRAACVIGQMAITQSACVKRITIMPQESRCLCGFFFATSFWLRKRSQYVFMFLYNLWSCSQTAAHPTWPKDGKQSSSCAIIRAFHTLLLYITIDVAVKGNWDLWWRQSVHLFTVNIFCLHLDWRDRGPVFHLWGGMVRHRWSCQDLLHQNMQRLGEAKADGVLAGKRNAKVRFNQKCLTSRSDLMSMVFFLFLSIRSFSHTSIQAHRPPSTKSSESICLSNLIRQCCDKTTSHSETYSSSCSVIPFVWGLCSAAWLRGPERAKLANSLEDLYVWVYLVTSAFQ